MRSKGRGRSARMASLPGRGFAGSVAGPAETRKGNPAASCPSFRSCPNLVPGRWSPDTRTPRRLGRFLLLGPPFGGLLRLPPGFIKFDDAVQRLPPGPERCLLDPLVAARQ